MTDRKGVDSIGRGRGSDGKRGGAELRRERRRCCAKDPVRVAGVENSGEEPISQTDPGHCDAELIRAGLHGGTGGERDHFIMAPR